MQSPHKKALKPFLLRELCPEGAKPFLPIGAKFAKMKKQDAKDAKYAIRSKMMSKPTVNLKNVCNFAGTFLLHSCVAKDIRHCLQRQLSFILQLNKVYVI